MTEQVGIPIHRRSDDALEAALRGFAGDIDWPSPTPMAGGPDLAARVRARIVAEEGGTAGAGSWRARWAGWRPARRALVLAVALLLGLAAVAAAIGFGLPGLHIEFGDPGSPPSGAPTAAPPTTATPQGSAVSSAATSLSPGPSATRTPGAGLGLGTPVALDELDRLAGFHVRFPPDAALGPPDTAWIDESREGLVTLVWSARDGLPASDPSGVGLIVSAFPGSISEGTFAKLLGPGTTLSVVDVDGHTGYWIEGRAHLFFYRGRTGIVVDERRWVGDVLVWNDGTTTWRLESELGREESIRLAESMR